MSLITCPDCRNKVSSHAGACPHCGCPSEVLSERELKVQQMLSELRPQTPELDDDVKRSEMTPEQELLFRHNNTPEKCAKRKFENEQEFERSRRRTNEFMRSR